MTDREMLTAIMKSIEQMNQDISHLKEKVDGIEWALTNVTNRNIQMITEEHTNLSRKIRKNENITKDVRSKMMEHEVLLHFLNGEIRHLPKKDKNKK